MHNGIALAEVAQELVAKACTLAGTLHKARDIHELHDGRGLFIGLPDLGQLVPVSYTHLDVYKRQLYACNVGEDDLMEGIENNKYVPLVAARAKEEGARYIPCLLYTSRCV